MATGARVGAVVSMRSVGGTSVFEAEGPIDAMGASAYASPLDDARHVASALLDLGFEITGFHPLAISFSGTPAQFQEVFGVRLERTVQPGGRGRSIEVYTPAPEDAPRLLDLPAAFAGSAEGVAIACPPRLIDDAAPPVRAFQPEGRRCLPDELAMSVWGEGLASLDATGEGVVAAMIGTGLYRHRFFSERRYQALPTLLGPGQTGSLRDEHGQSTGEAACLFAGAPNLRLRPVKGLLDPVGDLLMTMDSEPRPDLILLGWGYDVDRSSWAELKAANPNLHNYLRLLELAIASATAQGVIVAAAAPRTWRSFPASHPDIITLSATGRRSTLGSEEMGAVSHLYPERQAPDFWSRASETEAGRLDEGFIQPSQPGSALACMRQAEGSAADEGWAAADLDQASVPLAASLIALFIERYPGLPTPAIKALMAKAAEEGAFDGLIESDGMASVGMTFAADAMTDLAMSAVNDHVASEPDAVRLNAAG